MAVSEKRRQAERAGREAAHWEEEFSAALSRRVYVINVCTLCASDNIVSTEQDSWCEECQKWMSAKSVTVQSVPDNPIVHAAIQAAHLQPKGDPQ